MEVARLIRYPNPHDYQGPADEVARSFLHLSEWLRPRKSRNAPRQPAMLTCLVGFFPEKGVMRPQSVSLLAFSRCKTAYRALSDIEDVLAEYYMTTGILPVATFAPHELVNHPEDIRSDWRRMLHARGVLLFVRQR